MPEHGLLGYPIVLDETMPPDEVHFVTLTLECGEPRIIVDKIIGLPTAVSPEGREP